MAPAYQRSILSFSSIRRLSDVVAVISLHATIGSQSHSVCSCLTAGSCLTVHAITSSAFGFYRTSVLCRGRREGKEREKKKMDAQLLCAADPETLASHADDDDCSHADNETEGLCV